MLRRFAKRLEKSDAYATGLALFVLSQQNSAAANAAIARAQAFLVTTQRLGGTWPMVSRASEPTGPGAARDLGPITYIATAWATIGLSRSSPPNTVKKKLRSGVTSLINID